MKSRSKKENAPELLPSEASNVKNQDLTQGFNMSDSTQHSSSRAITVPFHGAELYVVEHNGQPYTPMKPIVSAIGLDWKSQHKKVAANEMRWAISVMEIPSTMVDSTIVGSADGKIREMACIPVRKVAAWLTTIEPGKVKNPEVRARVIQYQNECDDVLWQYWNEGIAINSRQAFVVNPGDVLTKDEAETLRLMLKTAADRLPKEKQGALMMQGWSKLKSHFKVSYREIPRHEFSEAVSIIARHTAEWEVVDEEPTSKTDDAVRLDWAFTAAAQTGAKVQREVFRGVMTGNTDWKHSRYLVSLDKDDRNEEIVVQAKQIDQSAYAVTLPQLAKIIQEPGSLIESQELMGLATACMSRLAARIGGRPPALAA